MHSIYAVKVSWNFIHWLPSYNGWGQKKSLEFRQSKGNTSAIPEGYSRKNIPGRGKWQAIYFSMGGWCGVFKLYGSGLEKSTRPLVFTSASGCRASEILDDSQCKLIFYPYMSIIFVMQGKCLFWDISRPVGHWCLTKSKYMGGWYFTAWKGKKEY